MNRPKLVDVTDTEQHVSGVFWLIEWVFLAFIAN